MIQTQRCLLHILPLGQSLPAQGGQGSGSLDRGRHVGEELPLPRPGHPQETTAVWSLEPAWDPRPSRQGADNICCHIGPEELVRSVCHRRPLAALALGVQACLSKDRESHGLWGQKLRVAHCLPQWQGHRGQVELGELGSVVPGTHPVTSPDCGLICTTRADDSLQEGLGNEGFSTSLSGHALWSPAIRLKQQCAHESSGTCP